MRVASPRRPLAPGGRNILGDILEPRSEQKLHGPAPLMQGDTCTQIATTHASQRSLVGSSPQGGDMAMQGGNVTEPEVRLVTRLRQAPPSEHLWSDFMWKVRCGYTHATQVHKEGMRVDSTAQGRSPLTPSRPHATIHMPLLPSDHYYYAPSHDTRDHHVRRHARHGTFSSQMATA